MNTVSEDPAASHKHFRAILLGASDWPRVETLGQSDAFIRSKAKFHAYLRQTLALQDHDILDLFDQDHSSIETNEKIFEFLDRHESDGKPGYTHLIIYYTGHGDFTSDQNFQLILRSTSGDQKDWTGYQMRMLAQAISQKARNATKLVILDCCYAAASFKDWQFQSEGDLNTKIEKEAENHFAASSGTALLCACNEDEWALLKKDDPNALTMFSGGLMSALEQGDEDRGAMLSIADLEDLAERSIRDAHGPKAVRPILHIAKGRRDEIATQLLFPNPARDRIEADDRIAQLENTVAMLQAEIQQRELNIKQDLDDAVTNISHASEDQDFTPWTRLGIATSVWHSLDARLQTKLLDVLDARRFSTLLLATAMVVFLVNIGSIAAAGFNLFPSPVGQAPIFEPDKLVRVLIVFNLTALVILSLFSVVGLFYSYANGLRLGRLRSVKDAPIDDPVVRRTLSLTVCNLAGQRYLLPPALAALIVTFFSTVASTILIENSEMLWRGIFTSIRALVETSSTSASGI